MFFFWSLTCSLKLTRFVSFSGHSPVWRGREGAVTSSHGAGQAHQNWHHIDRSRLNNLTFGWWHSSFTGRESGSSYASGETSVSGHRCWFVFLFIYSLLQCAQIRKLGQDHFQLDLISRCCCWYLSVQRKFSTSDIERNVPGLFSCGIAHM